MNGSGEFGGRVYAFDRRRRRRAAPFAGRDADIDIVLSVVAQSRGTPVAELLEATRGRPEAALDRQLAMYLAHVVLRRTFTEIGRIFGRDRTTVAHACAVIEDARDGAFDDEVSAIEEAIAARRAAPVVVLEARRAR